jgi:hypothetical protein
VSGFAPFYCTGQFIEKLGLKPGGVTTPPETQTGPIFDRLVLKKKALPKLVCKKVNNFYKN